jgi:murein DD-endopeptidase MepM/ murein hydrolase activator NlpD
MSPARRPIVIALTSAIGCIVALTASGAPPVVLDPRIRARSLAPGEPVRIVVVDERLSELSGTFLGRALSFHSRGEGRWTAWSLVPLDRSPGLEAVEVRGETRSGRAAVGTRAVRIEARSFPEEHLEVSSRYVEPPAEVVERITRERARLARLYEARNPPPDDGSPFVAPVPGEPTSVFGTRRLYNGKPRDPHPGLDLRAPEGTPVRCSGPGRVVLAEDLYYSGNTVVVDHGGGLFTLYAHLSRIEVAEGAAVSSREVLGSSGSTGRVTGPHLHWGAKIGDEPFDPRALLDEELFR